MKFLANENFPKPAVDELRKHGCNVTYIFESDPGINDEKVISKAKEEGSIILTFDKDYGEIIFRYKISNPPSIVFFRAKGNNPVYAANILLTILTEKKISLENYFTIIEDSGIRQRKYA